MHETHITANENFVWPVQSEIIVIGHGHVRRTICYFKLTIRNLFKLVSKFLCSWEMQRCALMRN